jgi:hypothetical protein
MRQTFIILVSLLACRCASATTLVGPSTAVLEGKRFGISVEYNQADADLTFDLAGGDLTESFDFQTVFGVLSVGLTDRWDFYVRLGASDAETAGFDGDMDFAWGMGTRVTAFQRGDFSWGALAQFTSLLSQYNSRERWTLPDATVALLDTEQELRVTEYLFATGPTWQHGPLSVYGGLLVRYTTGELEADARIIRDQFDIDAQWDAGGYVGGRVTLFKSATPHTYGFARGDLMAEGRFTGDGTGWSIGLLLPFGGDL